MLLDRRCSPDGLLTLIVREDDGDISIGFDGLEWHTHADLLTSGGSVPEDVAVRNFVEAIAENRYAIAVLRRADVLVDAWVTDDPAKQRAYTQPGESLELRYWDGSRVM